MAEASSPHSYLDLLPLIRELCRGAGGTVEPHGQREWVFVDGVAQSLETRHTRLFREFKDRP